ncbi:mitogen-activated protein kinase kinase kinase 14 [Pseudophryne corroboree]|uniref:mitogen-activated protein kinase kinase kinase 14 n=1 Tax=Pseudophryne corroboree TaxID=495146 RepID=UPI0030816251
MAIDYQEGQDQVSTSTLDYPVKLYQSTGVLNNQVGKAGKHNVLLQKKDGPWDTVLLIGTAIETEGSPAKKISIIAQAECENNQQICPSSQQGPLYMTDCKQYSLCESNEHIPNNVVNCTEGKLAQSPRFPKSKKKRRKRTAKNDPQTSARRGQTTPEQETRTPVPVQDEESQSKQWYTNDTLDYCSTQQHNGSNIDYPIQNKEHCMKTHHHKLIAPSQFLYHVGAGKLQPPTSPQGNAPYNRRLPGIISALGLDDWEDNLSPHCGYSKFTNSCIDSKTQSVEEGVLLALRESVSNGVPHNLCTLAKAWKNDDEEEVVDNEGILLREELKMEDYEYREDKQWMKCKELGSGSFGDVYLGKDKKTGFLFAAKKIHKNRFRSQELTCCLSVDSEKILPVYGAVREGPWVTVFMKFINGGSLGQLIMRRGYLTEELALYYMAQVLLGLKHLHAANVVHGDIKADNVLLSEDSKTVYLCDFGHAAHLPPGKSSAQLVTSEYVPGTETHMAPDIAGGKPCDTKVDVWSACCMFLHMLNGWHPWSRTHTAPLCLKIATEPPPIHEIPPSCHMLTRNIITAGLQKDPSNRATAADLLEKVNVALTKMGGVKFPHSSEYREPRSFPVVSKEVPEVTHSKSTLCAGECGTTLCHHMKCITEIPTFTLRDKSVDQPKISCDMEIERLEIDLYKENLSQPFLLEEQQEMFLSGDSLELLPSHKDSMTTLDTKSSGIYSWDSQMEQWSLQSDSLSSGGITAPSWFNGVKVKLQTFSGEIFHIWESGRTKLGDLAVGISSQIPIKSFTILSSNGISIPWSTDIADCGIDLQCSLAPDCGGSWLWRVKKGIMEEGNTGEVYTGGGTDAPNFRAPE